MGIFGYAASFEQFHPTDLLKWSQEAEQQGFQAVLASDHFHPWVPSQGQSAFVWSWMGALGAVTNLRFGTGVTPPGFRYHPAVLAQAAATLEAMYPGRFFLGLGAGEALN
jgi:coenzyme F420-dependent glucose-6-phosphate dehydrogenase